MQKAGKSQKALSAHRKVQASTARSRKAVRQKKVQEKKVTIEQVSPEKQTTLEKEIKKKSHEKKVKVEKVLPEKKIAAEKILSEKKVKAGKALPEQKAEKPNQVKKSPAIKKFNIEIIESPEPPKEQKVEKQIAVAEVTETVTAAEVVEKVAVAEAPQDKTQTADKAQTLAIEMPQADLSRVHARMQLRKMQPAQPEAPIGKVMKEQAIAKALAAAAQAPKEKPQRMRMDWKRVALALACASAAVAAIVYFVNLNAPDISLRVAAMQTGIEASYPSYVPRDFSLSDIASEDGRVVLNFKNSSTGTAYSIIEEKSSWDSNALLTNYVKSAFSANYSTIKEQGLTIYIDSSNAAWVNGGVVYKIRTTAGSLTKKQITTIATSL